MSTTLFRGVMVMRGQDPHARGTFGAAPPAPRSEAAGSHTRGTFGHEQGR